MLVVSAVLQTVTFTAIVTADRAGAGTPTGTVTFTDTTTGATLGTVPLANGRASLTTADLAAGDHLLSARYNGASVFFASDAQLTQQVDYAFGGFRPPLQAGGSYKVGSTVPIKFQLTDYAGQAITALSAVRSLQIQALDAAGQPTAPPCNPSSSDWQGLRVTGN